MQLFRKNPATSSILKRHRTKRLLPFTNLLLHHTASTLFLLVKNKLICYSKKKPYIQFEANMKAGKLAISTGQHMELADITAQVNEIITKSGVEDGVCYLFNPHTTAGLTINEGADPAVKEDIIDGLREFVPLRYRYKHLEGNSPSHIMASLMGSSLTIFIEKGQALLGIWQKIFFCEFDGPRTREIIWRISPDS